MGADWIDVRHDGVLVARHTRSLHKGQREPGVGPLPEGSSCTPAGCVGRCHRPGQCPGRPAGSPMGTNGFWDTARRKAGDRDGTKALTGVLLLHAPCPPRRCSPGSTQRWGGAPSSSGPGHPSGCGGPWRKFRYTLANFVSPDMPPGAACPSRSVDEHPRGGSVGVKRRSQTGHGRPGVVPRRDLGCGVRGCHGFAAPVPPFLGVGGGSTSPGRDHHYWPPRRDTPDSRGQIKPGGFQRSSQRCGC